MILHTPIPQIELAIAGRVDFVKKTNPWGSGSTEQDDEAKRLAEAEPDPEAAQKQFVAFVQRTQRRANRQGKRRNK